VSIRDVKRSGRALIVLLGTIAFVAAPAVAKAGPFVDFFTALRRSITHPQQKRNTTQSHKRTNDKAASTDGTNTHKANSSVNEPPNEHNVVAAKQAANSKEEKSELPYGTPVPGKKGFVTSPFAPDRGYVDVRGFPPGTEVKDPYTGKVFRTP